MSLNSNIPTKLIVQNINESKNYPTIVDVIVLSQNNLFFVAFFIIIIKYEFTIEPTKKAQKEAQKTLGV